MFVNENIQTTPKQESEPAYVDFLGRQFIGASVKLEQSPNPECNQQVALMAGSACVAKEIGHDQS